MRVGRFGIMSKTVHPTGESDAKGYRRADFEDLWGRYLPSETSSRLKTDERSTSCVFSSVRDEEPGRIKNRQLSQGNGRLDAGTDRKPENGGDGIVGSKTSSSGDLGIPDFLDRRPRLGPPALGPEGDDLGDLQ